MSAGNNRVVLRHAAALPWPQQSHSHTHTHSSAQKILSGAIPRHTFAKLNTKASRSPLLMCALRLPPSRSEPGGDGWRRHDINLITSAILKPLVRGHHPENLPSFLQSVASAAIRQACMRPLWLPGTAEGMSVSAADEAKHPPSGLT